MVAKFLPFLPITWCFAHCFPLSWHGLCALKLHQLDCWPLEGKACLQDFFLSLTYTYACGTVSSHRPCVGRWPVLIKCVFLHPPCALNTESQKSCGRLILWKRKLGKKRKDVFTAQGPVGIRTQLSDLCVFLLSLPSGRNRGRWVKCKRPGWVGEQIHSTQPGPLWHHSQSWAWCCFVSRAQGVPHVAQDPGLWQMLLCLDEGQRECSAKQ